MARATVTPTTELGRRLETWRENAGVTREAAAKILGIRPNTYIDWLRGGQPQWPNMLAVAALLDADPGEVFDWYLVGLEASPSAQAANLNSLKGLSVRSLSRFRPFLIPTAA